MNSVPFGVIAMYSWLGTPMLMTWLVTPTPTSAGVAIRTSPSSSRYLSRIPRPPGSWIAVYSGSSANCRRTRRSRSPYRLLRTERFALYWRIAGRSISPLSYRVWQVGQSAIRLSNTSLEPSGLRGSMCATSMGCVWHAGIAQRCPASTLTSRSNGLGRFGRSATLESSRLYRERPLAMFRTEARPRTAGTSPPILIPRQWGLV